MKPLSHRLITIFFLLFTIGSQSCKHRPGTWINDKIANDERETFHTLNNSLLSYLQKNDLNGLGNIMSREFLEAPTTRRTIELCSIRLKKSKTKLLDEYYMVHETPDEQSVRSFKYELNSYTLKYEPLTREKYIAFFVLEKDGEKWLLTANYNKYKYGWKIDEIELNQYTLSGMTAPELYRKAQQEYDKGYLVNAVNHMNLSRQCSLPSVMWKYDEQDEMDAFYSKALNEAERRYTFPVVVDQLATKPRIIRLFTQDRGEGNYPMVYYISKVSLKDTNAVKLEHQQMRRTLPSLIPGLDQGNKIIYYTVFNGDPDWKKKNIPHFEITDRY